MSKQDAGSRPVRKIVIVGGVAAGASAAARFRRLDEDASLVVLERGGEASFANCGLPYYVGGEIEKREQLLVAGDRQLKGWLNLDVRTKSEVIRIDREKQEVEVRELETNRTYCESYDYLILSTGAEPIRPASLLEEIGEDHPRVLSLRSMPDVDQIKLAVDGGLQSVAVIGGGFIGLEVAEQLIHRNVSEVHLVEGMSHVMPPLDEEMAAPLHQQLLARGVKLHLGQQASRLSPDGERVKVSTSGGIELVADLVVMAIGVRPDTALAQAANLETNPRGAILVDAHHQTNDSRVFAAGDAVQVTEPVFGGSAYVPLGGPANRQGRLIADNIAHREGQNCFAASDLEYRGTQGTSIVRVFDEVAALTGQSEKGLTRLSKARGTDYEVVYATGKDHAGYFPNATPILIKLIFELPTGRVLGAQATGQKGIDKRMDIIAMAIQMKATVFDLAQTELCYAPPFGSAKDPVNMVGFMACNVLQGVTNLMHVSDLSGNGSKTPATILDVRTRAEFSAGSIPDAINIPLEELRQRIDEVPSKGSIVTYCKSGLRGYYAERILKQHGFAPVCNLSGGFDLWHQVQSQGLDIS